MASVHAPTLLYPFGGEQLASPTITVRWENPQTPDDNSRPVSYELFYAQNYSPSAEPDWIAIASVPSSASQFEWRVGRGFVSDHVRIGIRSRNSQGTRSIMSVSGADFSVNRSIVPVPKIVSPVSSGRYDSVIQVLVEADNLPDRSYYQFYYSSVSAGIPMTSIGQNTLVREIPLAWVTVELPASDDYIFYAAVVGPDGRSSELSTVEGISVTHEGFFIIDTLPPVSSVKIEGGSLFTRDKDISVSVYAFDEATGVQSLQLMDGTAAGAPQKMKVRTSYTLHGADGVKQVRALVQDFGANRNPDDFYGNLPSLVNAAPFPNADVIDFHISVDSGVTFVNLVTAGNDQNALYQYTISDTKTGFPRRIALLPATPTSVVGYLAEEYVGIVDDEGVGHLLKYLTTGWETITSYLVGEYITDMDVHGDFIYIGTNRGHLYRYDGGSIRHLTDGTDTLAVDGTLDSDVWGVAAITQIKSDGSKLFVMFENTPKVAVIIGDYLLYR